MLTRSCLPFGESRYGSDSASFDRHNDLSKPACHLFQVGRKQGNTHNFFFSPVLFPSSSKTSVFVWSILATVNSTKRDTVSSLSWCTKLGLGTATWDDHTSLLCLRAPSVTHYTRHRPSRSVTGLRSQSDQGGVPLMHARYPKEQTTALPS